MAYSIPTLLTRNLYDVFGENDPALRRAAIDERPAFDAWHKLSFRNSPQKESISHQ
jgi:hypothetical protein